MREWFAGEARPAAWTSPTTGSATSGPGGATPTAAAVPAASSPGRTSTACRTAAPSTVRSAWSVRFAAVDPAGNGFEPAGPSGSSTSSTRRGPGSASPAPGRG